VSGDGQGRAVLNFGFQNLYRFFSADHVQILHLGKARSMRRLKVSLPYFGDKSGDATENPNELYKIAGRIKKNQISTKSFTVDMSLSADALMRELLDARLNLSALN
jgi:hypothetical protein